MWEWHYNFISQCRKILEVRVHFCLAVSKNFGESHCAEIFYGSQFCLTLSNNLWHELQFCLTWNFWVNYNFVSQCDKLKRFFSHFFRQKRCGDLHFCFTVAKTLRGESHNFVSQCRKTLRLNTIFCLTLWGKFCGELNYKFCLTVSKNFESCYGFVSQSWNFVSQCRKLWELNYNFISQCRKSLELKLTFFSQCRKDCEVKNTFVPLCRKVCGESHNFVSQCRKKCESDLNFCLTVSKILKWFINFLTTFFEKRCDTTCFLWGTFCGKTTVLSRSLPN